MKKFIFTTLFIAIGIFTFGSAKTHAQMMGFSNSSIDSAAIQSQQAEEQTGKQLLDELNAKTVTCQTLTDDNFEKIGEYYMGKMIGDTARHIAMNSMMQSMLGQTGEEQAHIAMGKRISGCDTSAAFPPQGVGFMPMMQMMMGGWSSPSGSNQSNNSMMNFGFTPFGGFGWIFMILWWALIIVGIVALINWLSGQSRGVSRDHDKSPLEILKERYARGEIDKKEFEDKKKDLV